MKTEEFPPSCAKQLIDNSDDAAPQPDATDAVLESNYALIAEQPFFDGLKPQQLHLLAASALRVHFRPEQRIFQEGSPANRFYLILRGKVAIESRDEAGNRIRIMTLGPGDDLGWSWLFPPYYLHFSAYALEPTEAISFFGTRLRRQCEEDRDLSYEIMKRVAKVVIKRLETSRHNKSGLLVSKHD